MKCFDIELKNEYVFLGNDGKNPTVSAYLPYNLKEMGRENQKRPCMVVCPGGAYAICSERESEPIALKFLNLGFNVFVLNYSVMPHRYPTQLTEVAATFDLIYKNADRWHCDTDKIGIIGFSAGGHLAAHYSNAYNNADVRALFADSKRPGFTVLGYPVISSDKAIAHQGSFINLLGKYPESDSFSCECLVSEETPKAFIWHTAGDEGVSVQNSLSYANALAKHNIPFSLHVYPYGQHGLSTVDLLTNDACDLDSKKSYAAKWLVDLEKWLRVEEII